VGGVKSHDDEYNSADEQCQRNEFIHVCFSFQFVWESCRRMRFRTRWRGITSLRGLKRRVLLFQEITPDIFFLVAKAGELYAPPASLLFVAL
jgi:hypothetical protein